MPVQPKSTWNRIRWTTLKENHPKSFLPSFVRIQLVVYEMLCNEIVDERTDGRHQRRRLTVTDQNSSPRSLRLRWGKKAKLEMLPFYEVNVVERWALILKAPRKSVSENVVCLCRLLNILANFSNLFLHTGKQYGSRSDCLIWVHTVCRSDF